MALEKRSDEALRKALEDERAIRLRAEMAEERLAFLYQATSTLFAAPLDPRSRFETLTKLLVPSLADWAIVESAQGERDRSVVAACHWNPVQRERCRALVDAGSLPDPVLEALVESVVRTGVPELVTDVAGHLPLRGAPLLEQLGARSLLVAPLRSGAARHGAIVLVYAESSRRYEADDVPLIDDLGQRAALAIENARLFRDVERAVRSREELVSIASHDVRNPLSAAALRIHVLLSRLEKGAAEPERVHGTLEGVRRLIGDAVGLLDDILNVSHIVSGRLRLQLEPVDLEALVREVLDRSRDLLAAAGCVATLRTGGRRATGRWDRVRLEQVFSNLLSNAMKYGRGKPIECQLECDGQTAVLTVVDHGIGIEPSQQTRIFERFSRATDREERASHGLGLWIVKQIVTALGGTVSVSSSPGAGAAFTVRLPVGGPAAEAAPGG